MYTIIHHYLTLGDGEQPTVELDTTRWDGSDVKDLITAIRDTITYPGGRSGTTISLTVSLAEPTSL